MNESGDRLNLKEESLLSELGEELSRDGLAAWILQEEERGMQSPFSRERERKSLGKEGEEEIREGGKKKPSKGRENTGGRENGGAELTAWSSGNRPGTRCHPDAPAISPSISLLQAFVTFEALVH